MRKLFPLAGSSAKYAPVIAEIIRREGHNTYSEPMIGSGAVYFELCPGKAFIGDINYLTADLYRVIKLHPLEFTAIVREIPPTREEFEDRQRDITSMVDPIERAATWYYLLWMCYNGVVKFYPDGTPNLTWGDRYKTWEERFKYRAQHILIASTILQDTEIFTGDYHQAPPADIGFFDPPWIGSAEDYGVDFDHDRLMNYLEIYPGKWILTINDRKEAREIYEPISSWLRELNPYYSVAPVSGKRRRTGELLMTNFVPQMFGG